MATSVDQAQQTQRWHALAQQLRIDSIRASTAAGSGHPTSSMSAADLLAVLIDKYLHYDFTNPKNPNNAHLIFSKGHASPLLYSVFKAAGAVTDQELLTFRKFGSRLQGHPTPAIPWVDVATGSLGQGLPISVGIALAAKYLEHRDYKIWVLLGDSEMAEGSVWEAFDKASYYKLNNIIALLDMNRLGQRGQTELGWNSEAYAERARAFGWHAIEINGHNLEEIDRAYAEAIAPRDEPTLIVARTMKGRGVSFLENQENWHGKALSEQQAQQAIAELGGITNVAVTVAKPEAGQVEQPKVGPVKLPAYAKGSTVATRQAYGDALAALGAGYPNLVVLDAEVSNSTFAETFKKAYPDRFFEMFIAEQQLVGSAVGMSVRGYIPFASTFAAFMTRAFDFIRMAAVSRANIRLCGSHAGVSIGEDGPSQMALEDLAMMRAVFGSTVLYPSDPNQAAQLVQAMAEHPGISYLRTTREKTPVLYDASESCVVGGSRVVQQSSQDQVAIIAAGITLHESLKAYDTLKAAGISARIIDAYSVKPIDARTLWDAANATNGRLVVVEDHWPEGGLGSAVEEAFTLSAGWSAGLPLRLVHLAVSGMPTSGTPQELLNAAGISASHIVDAVKGLVK